MMFLKGEENKTMKEYQKKTPTDIQSNKKSLRRRWKDVKEKKMISKVMQPKNIVYRCII